MHFYYFFITHKQTIGDNTVIGAGSVVVKDIPSNVVAVGNPCKVLRGITKADQIDYDSIISSSGLTIDD